MQLITTTFDRSRGWSRPLPRELDSERTLLIVFGSTEYLDDPEPLLELKKSFPQSHVIGCSTSGEIHGGIISDGTLSVAALQLGSGSLRTTTASVPDGAQSFAAGERIARDLSADDLRGILVLSEGLTVNGTELAQGIDSSVPRGTIVTGGLAGDGSRFSRTWVMDGNGPRQHIVTAVGLYGPSLRIGYGSRGGWDIFGPERTITRSEANVLFELDGRPALELYKTYLGDRASGLPATALLFPLCVTSPKEKTRTLVRTVLSIDEEKQSMTFAGDVPQGWKGQLMRANFDRLIDGASSAASMVDVQANGSPTLAIAISCVGRRLVLGDRTEEEVEATLDALPEGCQLIGFYSYGELSPLGQGSCELHNQTMTLTTLTEA
jgi:hypothetical protein